MSGNPIELLVTPEFRITTDRVSLFIAAAAPGARAVCIPLKAGPIALLCDNAQRALTLALSKPTVAQTALAIAVHEMQLGAGEEGDNNTGPWVKKYINRVCELPANWCAGFVSWCFREAARQMGLPHPPFPYQVGARRIFQYGEEQGWQVPDLGNVQPGDIVVWWRESMASGLGHVGIVVKYDDSGYRVIEGNRGEFPSKVRIFDYSLAELRRPYEECGLVGVIRIPG